MDGLRSERRPGVWHSGGLKIDSVEGRGMGQDGQGGWAELWPCGGKKVKTTRLDIGRRRENERDWVSFYRIPKRRACKATPIGLWSTVAGRTETSVVPRHVEGGGGTFYFLLFSFACSANHERDWPPIKIAFSG